MRHVSHDNGQDANGQSVTDISSSPGRVSPHHCCCLNLGLLYNKNKIYKLKIQYILFLYIQNENMKKEQSRLKNIRHVQQII